MSCPPTSALTCCITLTLEAAYTAFAVTLNITPTPSITIPPGILGIPVQDFNPYAICGQAIGNATPKFQDPGRSLVDQLYAIRAILAFTAALALAALAWRWWRDGASGVWLLRRMSGAKGTYIVPNPGTLFCLPVICFTIVCQFVVQKALVVIRTETTSSTTYMLLLFIVCIIFLWLAGFIQGTALLFSVDRFLAPRNNQTIWVSSTSNPFSIQNVPPTILNTMLVAIPATFIVGAITAATLASHWEKVALVTFKHVVTDMDQLAVQYANANGTIFLPTSPVDNEIVQNVAVYNHSKKAALAAFGIVVGFDAIGLAFYLRMVLAVIGTVRRQLAVLKQTTAHFEGGNEGGRRPSRTLERNWSRMTSTSNFDSATNSQHGGARRSNSFGRDARDDAVDEERAAKRRRLTMSYWSILALAIIMVATAAVDTAFCVWAASVMESFGLFLTLLPAALWIWTAISLFSVGVIAWQAFSSHTPAAPVRSLVALTAPPDPNRNFYYGRDEEAADEADEAYRAAVLAKAQSNSASGHRPSQSSIPSPLDTPVNSAAPFFPSYRPPEAARIVGHPFSLTGSERRRGSLEVETPSQSDQSSSDPSSKPSKDEDGSTVSTAQSRASQQFTPSRHFRAAFEPPRVDEEEEEEEEENIMS